MAHPIYADFTVGEVSPRVTGRVDLAIYNRACRQIQNFLVQVQGGVERRIGTQYCGELYTSAAKSRIVGWEDPTTQYVLELSVGRIRVWSTGTTPAVVHTITTLVPWTTAAEIAEMSVAFDGAYQMYFAHKNWKPARLVHASPYGDTNWTLDIPTYTITGYADTNLFNLAGHYPACCLFFSTRLAYANSVVAPNTIWFSATWNAATGAERYTIFTLNAGVTIDDSLGFSTGLMGNRGGEIRWLSGRNALVAGTSAGEFILGDKYALVPSKISDIKNNTNYGGSRYALSVGDAVLFVQKGKRRIREITITDQSLQYVANDLTTLAEHITGATGLYGAMDYSSIPCAYVFAPRLDGLMAVLTYEKGIGIMAWQRYLTDGAYEGVCVVTTSAEEDQVWYIVNRTINGVTKRYLEREFTKNWTALRDAGYVDCATVFDNGAPKAMESPGVDMVSPIQIHCAGHSLIDGDKVRFDGIVGTTELNGNVYTVHAPLDANHFYIRDEADANDVDGTTVMLTLDGAPNCCDRGDCESAISPMVSDETVPVLANATWARDTARARSGSSSFKYTKTTGAGTDSTVQIADNSLTTDMHGFLADQTVTLSVWIYVPSASGMLGTEAIIQIYDYASGAWAFSTGTAQNIYDQWQQVTVTRTIRAAATAVRPLIRFHQSSASGEYYYVDDIEIDGGPFAPGDVITGVTSGKTATIISAISSSQYYCNALTRPGFTAGERLTSGGARKRDCFAPYPDSSFYFTEWVSGGQVEKVQKSLTGLTHLALKEVQILGDGAVIPPETVAVGGTLTLDSYANKIIVGLPYVSYLMPMPLEAGAVDGTAQGRRKRIDRLTARVHNSLGCKTGQNANVLETLRFRETPAPMTTPTPLFTGDIEVPFPGDFDTTGDLLIVQDEPLPLTIVALMPRLQTNE